MQNIQTNVNILKNITKMDQAKWKPIIKKDVQKKPVKKVTVKP